MRKNKNNKVSREMQRFSLLGNAIFVLTSLVVISISFYAFLYLVLSMLPTVVALINDRSVGKCASNTVGAFNFMGVMPSLFKIWRSGDASSTVQGLITDPNIWLISYGSAALGWLMVLFMPKMLSLIFTSRSEAKINALKKAQDKLIEEWGFELKNHSAR